MSGQVTNQNGNPLQPPQMQASTGGGGCGGGPPPNQHIAEPELHRAYMRDQIFNMLMQKSVQPVNEAQRQKVNELAIRLEEGLFKAAQTKDEFVNLSTLESRLSNLIRRPTVNSHNNAVIAPSACIGNMIPTPGMQRNVMNTNMNVQAHTSGQVTSQNGNPLPPPQMQASTGGGCGGGPPPNQHIPEPELPLARAYMRDHIFNVLMRKCVRPLNEAQRQKVNELVNRLEDRLFMAAQTKDDFLNLSTLESRLSNLLRRPTANSHNQRPSSARIGNMIPTPGMQQNVMNSNMMMDSSDDTTIVTLFSSLELK